MIIKLPDTIPQSTLSKAFALLLIEVHETIDYCSGIDTIFFCWGGGGHYGFCHSRHAVMNILNDRSSHQYFITQHKGWARVLHSLLFALYVIKILVGES